MSCRQFLDGQIWVLNTSMMVAKKDDRKDVLEANAILYETENCYNIKLDSDKLVVIQVWQLFW